MNPICHFSAATLTLLCLASSVPAGASDSNWPRFRGAGGSGVSTETGLLDQWPEKGPKEIWRVPLGSGFSEVAVQGDRLYTQFSAGNQEVIAAFRQSDGGEIWRTILGENLVTELGDGPRPTPSVADGRVYTMGSAGVLMALDAKNGKVKWQVDLAERFKSHLPHWGLSSSALVDGDLVILEVGGEEAAFAALDKETGKTVWTALEKSHGYNTPVAMTLDGVHQYIFAPTGAPQIVSLLPDGSVYWTHDWHSGTIAMPVAVGDDGVFVSASQDVGGMLLRVRSEEGKPVIEEVWRSREMKNHFSSSLAYDGYIYGFDNGALKCIDAATGERKWAKRGLGKGSLISADGKLFVLSDRGKLVLAMATPEGYQEKGRLQVLEGKTWTAPSLAHGRLFLRDHKNMVCLDVRTGG